MRLLIFFVVLISSGLCYYCTNNTYDVFESRKDIKEIKEKSFNQCNSLLSIDFTYNFLEILPNKIFHQNKKLQSINFAHNSIYFLDRYLFIELHNLTKVDFSYNKLIYLHFPSFTFTKVQYLNIAHNKIVNIKRTSLCSLLNLR